MGYIAKRNQIDALDSSIALQVNAWLAALKTLEEAASDLVGSQYISGNTADRMKDYFSSVYSSVLTTLRTLIGVLTTNWQSYYADYHGVDNDAHFVIDTDELKEINAKMLQLAADKGVVEAEGKAALSGVSHLTSAVFPDFSRILTTHLTLHDHIDALITNVENVEASHMSGDFQSVQSAVEDVIWLLGTVREKDIIYKTHFDKHSFADSKQYRSIYSSYENLIADLNGRKDAFQRAGEARQQRFEQLQAEYEAEVFRRQEKAEIAQTWFRVGTSAVTAAASIGTLGLGAGATIGIMAGAGAFNGAITAGSNSALDSYVQNGWEGIDWGDAFKAAGKGTLIGGAFGAGSGAVAYYAPIASDKFGSILANIGLPQPVADFGAKATTGTINKVLTGGSQRFTSALYDDKSIGEAWEAATNWDKIKKDAVKGFTSECASALFNKVISSDDISGIAQKAGYEGTIAPNVIQGGMKSGFAGIASRFTTEMVLGDGNIWERLSTASTEAWDDQSIIYDVASGMASTAAGEVSESKAKQAMQSASEEAVEKSNENEAGRDMPEKGGGESAPPETDESTGSVSSQKDDAKITKDRAKELTKSVKKFNKFAIDEAKMEDFEDPFKDVQEFIGSMPLS